jgi:signal-transduction protein with cAMP-binding, CBS, and nucleotidyltransferase domain
MADCLLESTHGDGEAIIRQGDPGDAFYLLLEGNAAALVADESGVAREVMQYAAGMYFGEVALLRDEPRKATVAARLNDPGYAIVRPPLVAIGPAHHDQIANAKSLCFEGVSCV